MIAASIAGRLKEMKGAGGNEIGDISADDLRLCEEAFDLFDKDGDGTIDPNELKHLLRCFELPCDADAVDRLIEKYMPRNLKGLPNLEEGLSFKSIVAILQPSFKKDDTIEVEI